MPKQTFPADFLKAMAFDLEFEGRVYENVPGDPGGPTKWGITWRDANWYLRLKGKPTITEEEAARTKLAVLTEDVIYDIYYLKYWLPVKGNALPEPLDEVLFDCAVNTGLSQSVKFLQRTVGVPDTGQLDNATYAATLRYVEKHGQEPLVRALLARRQQFYDNLAASKPSLKKFLKGWTNRVKALAREAANAFRKA